MCEFFFNNRHAPAAATSPSGRKLRILRHLLYSYYHLTRHCHCASMWQGLYCTTAMSRSLI